MQQLALLFQHIVSTQEVKNVCQLPDYRAILLIIYH